MGTFIRNLTELVEAGKVKPLLDGKSFTFEDIGTAHDYQQNGNPTGKVAVTAQF